MTDMLRQIHAVMNGTYGKDLLCYDEPFLLRTLEIRCSLTGSENLTEYRSYLVRHPEEAEALSRSLVVSFSEFFRDTLTFAVLEAIVIPSLIKMSKGRMIRVWSAGCAGGEEAYSLAILFEDFAEGLGQPVPYRIFATTVDEADLERARTGLYDERALRNVRFRHLEHYFQKLEERYRVKPRARGQVDFSLYDLLDRSFTSPPSSIYGEFDLIVCSNVFMYYQPEIREEMVGKLFHSLVPGGFFVTSEAEREMIERISGCQPLFRPMAVYRKSRTAGNGGEDQKTGTGCRKNGA